MSCANHTVNQRGCKMCVRRVVGSLENQLLLLGPRTQSQMLELFARVCQAAPWATTPALPEFDCVIAEVGGKLMHVHHAEALSVAESVDFVPLSTPFARSRAAVRSAFVTKLLAIKRVNHRMCGRAKTKHQMYNAETMLAQIEQAGMCGISRTEIAAEYEASYLDLQKIIAENKVFATPERVWTRSCAPCAPPGAIEKFRARFCSLLHGV